jgi:hypothetical protein
MNIVTLLITALCIASTVYSAPNPIYSLHTTAKVYDWLKQNCPYWRTNTKNYMDKIDTAYKAQTLLRTEFFKGAVLCEVTYNLKNSDAIENGGSMSSLCIFEPVSAIERAQNYKVFTNEFSLLQTSLEAEDLFSQDMLTFNKIMSALHGLIPKDYRIQSDLRICVAGEEMVYENEGFKEFLETEKKYIAKIQNMYDFAVTLEKNHRYNPINLQYTYSLFPNINGILTFHIKQYTLLEQYTTLETLFQFFSNLEDETNSLYGPWFASRNDNVDTLKNHMEMLQGTNQVGKYFDDILIGHNSLHAMIVAPVQHLCRYSLLLESMAKQGKNPHDKNSFLILKSRMVELTRKINAARWTVDLHWKVKDWGPVNAKFLGNLLKLNDAWVISDDRPETDITIALYETSVVLLKRFGSVFMCRGMIRVNDIHNIQICSDNRLLIVYRDDASRPITLKFRFVDDLQSEDLTSSWYDALYNLAPN